MDQNVQIVLEPGPSQSELEAASARRGATEEANALVTAASGLIHEKQCHTAVAMLRRAIELRPDHHGAWCELGVAYHALGLYEKSRFALGRSLELNPTYGNARSNMALVQGILGEHEQAEATMRDLMLDPEREPFEVVHLAMNLLHRGLWDEGLRLYERRIGCPSREFVLPKLGAPSWEGEDLNGRTLFVQTEQGIGDTIAFSRYLHWVKATYPDVRIKFNPHTAYPNLLWEFRDLLEFVPSGILYPTGEEQFDYAAYLHSLARHAGCTLDNVYPDPGLIRRRVEMQHAAVPFELPEPNWPDVRKVGICWTGNPLNVTQVRRSVPLEALLYLATDPGNQLYSLQCGEGRDDLTRLKAWLMVEDLSDRIRPDLVLTGNAMLSLDVVVTCCTSVAHLAGALGVPCFLMLCHEPFWLWGHDPTTTPWYPSVRLFRQKTRGDWNQVINDVATALKEL